MQRAATIAVMTLALVGVTGVATPGEAQSGQLVGQANGVRLSPAIFVQAAAEQGQMTTIPPTRQDAPLLPDPIPVPPAPAAEPSRFETLAAAVAAQDAADADEATRCLAGAIYFEAKGEPVDGQLAVAEVVINRARSGRFPPDVCGVVKQPGQFSFVRAGAIPDIDTARANYRTALAVAKVAMAKAWESSAPRAIFFHARRVPPSTRWVKVAAIGNHVFYR